MTKRKPRPYAYRYAVKVACAKHGSNGELTVVLRRLVRESVRKYIAHEIHEYAWDTTPEKERPVMDRIARELIP